MDIGLYYTQQGVSTVKSQPLYQNIDAQVNLEDKFNLVLNAGQTLYTQLDEKFRPIVQNVFFLFDSYTNQVTSYIKVITTQHAEIRTYVEKTYTTAQVQVNGTWMRLDFDNDGTVSTEDLKQSMVGLYDFLRNFDAIETTTQIKSKLYSDAITYMQNELAEDQKAKDAKE